MMSTISAEQNYNFHKIDIPPRKLLYRPSAATDENLNSAVFSKFLPHNDGDDSDDPYSSYHFRMYEFKVRRCSRSRSHDWTDCPFAHPGEKARRRDPRRHRYSGTVCSEFRKDGRCGDGDNCQFSHGVFECWLHPSRYRTEACKDRKNCKRKICFFAHSTRQLRLVPEVDNIPSPPSAAERKCRCYVYCHSPVAASPTSTLIGQMYNNLSPPISPVCSPEFSTYGGGCFSSAESCAALSELMEAMSMNESSPAAGGSLPWLDVNFHVEEQPQFVMSPSTPAAAAGLRRGGSEMFSGDSKVLMDERRYKYNNNEGNSGGPDLGWVNDLLT